MNTNLIVILTKHVQQCCGYFLPCSAHAKSSSLNSKQSPMVSIHSTIENVKIISNEEFNLWCYNYIVTHWHDPIENHSEGWCVLDQMDWNKKGQKKLSGPTIVRLNVYFFKIFPKKCVLIVDMNLKQSRNEKISCIFLWIVSFLFWVFIVESFCGCTAHASQLCPI